VLGAMDVAGERVYVSVVAGTEARAVVEEIGDEATH